MKKITVRANLLKAAKLYQSVKDVRYYLRGICIKPDGTIAATNGHRLFVVKDEKIEITGFDNGMPEIIIRYDGTIPANAYDAEILFMSDTDGVIQFLDASGIPLESNGIRKRLSFVIIDGNFPNYSNVMPKGDPIPVKTFGINAGYISDIDKLSGYLGNAKYNAVTFILYGENSSVVIKIKTPDQQEVTLLIMTMRL